MTVSTPPLSSSKNAYGFWEWRRVDDDRAGPLPTGPALKLLRRFVSKSMEKTSSDSFMSLARLWKIENEQVEPTVEEVAHIRRALSSDAPPEREEPSSA